MPSKLIKTRISIKNIAHNKSHLYNKFPVLIRSNYLGFCNNIWEILTCILIKTFSAVFLYPCKCSLVLFVIINSNSDTTKNFNLINPLCTNTKIFLKYICITEASCNSHRYCTDINICFIAHPTCCNCTSCKTKNFFCYISRNGSIVCILNIMSIDGKCRQATLCMCCQNCCQINSTWTFCSIESPYSLNCGWIHIKCLCSIAPAWCYR